MTGMGRAASKLAAKHEGARDILDKLDGRKNPRGGQPPLAAVEDTPQDNPVGALKELCHREHLNSPTYEAYGDQPDEWGNYTYFCCVDTADDGEEAALIQCCAMRGKKKQAKKEAARGVLDQLTGCNQRRTEEAKEQESVMSPHEAARVGIARLMASYVV